MDPSGKQHQKFFNNFVKYSIFTTLVVVILLVLLYIFLV
ncbi:MAG: hypothetical protein CMP33_07755 [Rickettsiales bacterium]|nr:hypothetical protein [Rickettsiales bacterium]